jgi:hypothetical protein
MIFFYFLFRNSPLRENLKPNSKEITFLKVIFKYSEMKKICLIE